VEGLRHLPHTLGSSASRPRVGRWGPGFSGACRTSSSVGSGPARPHEWGTRRQPATVARTSTHPIRAPTGQHPWEQSRSLAVLHCLVLASSAWQVRLVGSSLTFRERTTTQPGRASDPGLRIETWGTRIEWGTRHPATFPERCLQRKQIFLTLAT
jgi:hypothetical protein